MNTMTDISPRTTDSRGLNKKQRDFVDYYMIRPESPDWCANQAGYNVGTGIGHKLLANKKVVAAIKQAQSDRALRIHLTQDRVVNELASVALANMADYVEVVRGQVIVKDDISEEKMAAVKSIQTFQNGTMKVALHDKMKALSDLAAHMGVTNFERKATDDDGDQAKIIKIVDRRTKVIEVVDRPRTLNAAVAADVVDAVDASYEQAKG